MPASQPGSVAVMRVGGDAAMLLSALHEQAFEPAERWDLPAMRSMLAMPGVVAFIGDHNAAAGGFIMGRIAADEAEILTLAVVPACRRRGVASALVARLGQYCREHGAGHLFLEVSVLNEGALSLYEGEGFRRAGRRRSYYPDGSDAYVLVRDFSSQDAT